MVTENLKRCLRQPPNKRVELAACVLQSRIPFVIADLGSGLAIQHFAGRGGSRFVVRLSSLVAYPFGESDLKEIRFTLYERRSFRERGMAPSTFHWQVAGVPV